MSDRVYAQHPDPTKQGTRIDANRYHMVREAITAVLADAAPEPVAFTDLIARAEDRLAGQFDGSVPWYVTTVKLDLEARGVIERVPGLRPQHLRLIAA